MTKDLINEIEIEAKEPQNEKQKREQLRAQLQQKIDEEGAWNINFHKLSRDWHLPSRTIANWKEQYIKKKGQLDLKKLGDNLIPAMIQNIKISEQDRHNAKTIGDRSKAINTMNNTVEKLTDFLEKYGYKQKVADKVEHLGANIVLHIDGDANKYPKVDMEALTRKVKGLVKEEKEVKKDEG